MQEAEFDKFADEYHALHAASVAASGESPAYFAEYKVKDLLREHLSAGAGGTTPEVLDFGSGSGSSISPLLQHMPGAHLTCVDVSKRSLELAESRFRGRARFVAFDGAHLPVADASFDIVFAACVFHHIDHAEHTNLLREWYRVIRPGGIAIIYEHNPLNPLTVKVVNSCPFDENARLIRSGTMVKHAEDAGFRGVTTRHRLFFPRALRLLRPLERFLSRVPFGAQYYVVARR